MMLTEDRSARSKEKNGKVEHTATHLLRNHDNKSSQCSPPHTRNGEQLYHSSDISASCGKMLFPAFGAHLLNISVS